MTKLPIIRFPFCIIVSAWLCSGVWATAGTLTVMTDMTLDKDYEANIVIAADGITLNCDGHTITAPKGVVLHGIDIRGRTGVTVENCRILGNDYIRKKRKDNEKSFGIYIHATQSCQTCKENSDPFRPAQSITIQNNTIEYWTVGVKLGVPEDGLDQGGNHRIRHNVLKHNSEDGLDCDGSDANDYWDNEVYENGENGFEFDNCHKSNDWGTPYIHENNRAHHNGKHGFSFDNSDNHRLHANSSYCNGWLQSPGAEDPHLNCGEGEKAGEIDKNGINDNKGWDSKCQGKVFGHGLRIDSINSPGTCDGKNPSTGIQADWNNWGIDPHNAGRGCGTNAAATVAPYLDYAIRNGATEAEKDKRGIYIAKDERTQRILLIYDNLDWVYDDKTNHCSP
jgi:Right handed beta helix region